MSFISKFASGKLGGIGQSVVEALASWDPETASQADIDVMVDKLDQITTAAAKARSNAKNKRKEATAAQENYDKHLKAGDILQQKLDAAPGDFREQINKSLEELLSTLEGLKPELARLQAEADQAGNDYKELEQFAKESANKLKTARDTLQRAKQDMDRAKRQEEFAEERAERAEQMAGLKQDTSATGTALNAFQKKAEEARQKADAASMKADLLGNATKKDDILENALKEAEGKPAEKESFADRLAALKK
jgi:chromosome segregation ATPase